MIVDSPYDQYSVLFAEYFMIKEGDKEVGMFSVEVIYAQLIVMFYQVDLGIVLDNFII